MDLSLLAIPILIVAILAVLFLSRQKTVKQEPTQSRNPYKRPKRKFDLNSLESRVRRRMVVSS